MKKHEIIEVMKDFKAGCKYKGRLYSNKEAHDRIRELDRFFKRCAIKEDYPHALESLVEEYNTLAKFCSYPLFKAADWDY